MRFADYQPKYFSRRDKSAKNMYFNKIASDCRVLARKNLKRVGGFEIKAKLWF